MTSEKPKVVPMNEVASRREGNDLEVIERELHDTVAYVNDQLEALDRRMAGADFMRSVYEARYWLLSQKLTALNSLIRVAVEKRKMDSAEEGEDLTDFILGSGK